MRPLNPIIKEVAEIYGFTIDHCVVLNKIIIKDEEYSCSFYWDSTYTDQDFWDSLKEHFIEIGAERTYSY